MRTSRLWRVLGATSHVFNVRSINHDAVFNDYKIVGISMTHGTSLQGFSASAGSFTIAGYMPQQSSANEQRVYVEIGGHGQDRLTALGITIGSSARRFHGRVTGQTTTDNGDGRPTTTVVNMQDWTSLAISLDKGAQVHTSARGLDKLLDSFYTRAGRGIIESRWGSSWHHVNWPEGHTADTVQLSTSDVSRYVSDAGMLVRTNRHGTVTVYSHDHLVDVAEQWADLWPDTLLRSQVLRPVSWVQPDSTSTKIEFRKITSAGSTVTGTITIGNPEYAVRDETVDLTHLREQGDGLDDALIARASRLGPNRPSVETAKVDLLALIERGLPADRATVSQLLNAEQGDIVVLAHDWPTEVIGVLFLQSIVETIGPDEWSMELNLVPANLVTGRPVPAVHGRTWHSAYTRPTTWPSTGSDRWDDK